MKKIVPFNNVLNFDTDVNEITAISLEHDIKKEKDAISGVFHVTGEYKITEGDLRKESFSFDLPFDIALGCNYDLDTLEVDIDDFRYELLDNRQMKVNIDMYIDGDKLPEETEDLFTEVEIRELNEDTPSEEIPKENFTERVELLDEMLDNDKENETVTENDNTNTFIFNGFNEEEKYVTYHVYPFTEKDTLDSVMEHYHVSKEELMKYNNLDDLKVGDKLIIPTSPDDK